MNDLPESLFANPVWHALHTKHRHFSISCGDACRYPSDVTPFAAVAAPRPNALEQLRLLLIPGESVWLIGDSYPSVQELSFEETMDCFQMILPEEVKLPDPSDGMVKLSDANAGEMVALTDIAFPGFFRAKTGEMGSYYGVRSPSGELIAMAGERLTLDGYPEISGVCTHPSHRGKGLAAALIGQVMRDHRRDGLVSWLQVGCANRGAIEVYLRLGFKIVRKVALHRIARHAETYSSTAVSA